MFEYEVVPVLITRGAGESEAGDQWAKVRAGLNELGRVGFRVVAVSEGAEGRAVIMERQIVDRPGGEELATATSVTEAAEEITFESADG
ncbi:MAG TPA: hypothetical protein VJN72_07240 [Gaiellales bacterium]|nr:hypothetical protein [Gaiellales bacterium]